MKVKDGSVVQNNNTWVQSLGAKGVVRNDNALQIIFGTHVITLAAQVKERLGME